KTADIHPQPSCNGGAHGVCLHNLTFDFAGLEDVFSKRGKCGLVAQRKHQDVQPPEEQPLGATGGCQRMRKYSEVIAPIGPVASLPDIGIISAIHAEIRHPFLRTCNYSPHAVRCFAFLSPAPSAAPAPASPHDPGCAPLT